MPKREQFKAKDKITHKMTRDGLVEVNETQGEQRRVSQRGQDFNLQERRQGAAAGNIHQAVSDNSVPAPARGRHSQPPHTENPPTQPAETYSQVGNKSERDADGRQSDYPHGQPEATRRDYSEPDTGHRPNTAARPEHTGDGGREPHHTRATEYNADTRRGGHSNRRQYAAHAQDSAQKRALAPENEYMPPQDTVWQSDTETPPAPRHEAIKPRNTTQNATEPARTERAPERTGRLRFGETEQAPPAASRQKGRRPSAGTKYHRKFAADAENPEPSATPQNATDIPASDTPDTGRRHDGPRHDPHTAPGENKAAGPDAPKRGKLQFTPDDLPPEPLSTKLTKARRKADRADVKLGRARDKLPVKRKVRLNKEFDADKGKVKRRLYIEKEVKSQRAHIKGPLPLRPVKHGANAAVGYAHKKMFQVENENVGVKAAHRAEMAAEGLGRSALRFAKTRPYRRVTKLERKATKAHIKLSYRQALEDNPALKSNLLSRFMQKQKIKRQYAKAAREAKKAAQRAKKGGDMIGKAAKAVAGFVKRHPALCITILLLALLVLFIMSAFSSCSNIAGGGFSSVFMSSYLAEDADIDNTELSYTEWETDLQIQINNAETDYPGYDEYRYQVDDIGHNPFELMAYLTARYQDFTFNAVEADLRAIFAEQYTLEFIPEIEIRTRTVSSTDPETGEESEHEEEYEWHILNIKLTARSFNEVIAPRMDAEQREMYGLYMETHGNRQYLLNPFDFDWLPYVSSYYGWRIHPFTGAKDYHKGIDIAVPTGTDILAGHDGRVVSAGSAGDYGIVVVLDDGKGLVSKYAHCDSLLVSVGQEVEKGDVIAKSGSTGNSTGPHLHLEVIKDGQYLNPLFFAEGANGGAAPGSPGGPVIPDYSGAPMGDGSYAALIAAAEAHLGKPYVFGAKGPNAFDCSGFVCAALRESGVKNISTNAQGLYNACTPVSLANAQPGDLLFFHSTYSTSNTVTHVAIYCGGNVMLHAGKPVQYTTFDTRYWQEHFYAVGRISD